MADMSMKGWVKEFDDSPTMNWWEEVNFPGLSYLENNIVIKNLGPGEV